MKPEENRYISPDGIIYINLTTMQRLMGYIYGNVAIICIAIYLRWSRRRLWRMIGYWALDKARTPGGIPLPAVRTPSSQKNNKYLERSKEDFDEDEDESEYR